MTVTTLTACDLLASGDPTLKALLQTWWEEKEIPVVLLDHLLDLEMYRQADALRWMLEQPKRRSGLGDGRNNLPTPIYFYSIEYSDYGWYVTGGSVTTAIELPSRMFHLLTISHWGYLTTKQGPEHAICLALDAWRGT